VGKRCTWQPETPALSPPRFPKILDHNGIVWNCWTGALAHLGVARANALAARTSHGAEAVTLMPPVFVRLQPTKILKHILYFAVATIAIGLMTPAAHAQRSDLDLRFHAPFPFSVGNNTFAAGDYMINRQGHLKLI
jgi:hypothetical protein